MLYEEGRLTESWLNPSPLPFRLFLRRSRMGLDEFPDCMDDHITEGYIRFISNSLKGILLISWYPHRHDSVSSFWHIAK